MSESSASLLSAEKIANPWLQSLTRKFSDLKHGRLCLVLPSNEQLYFGEGDLRATVVLKNYRPVSKFLLHGDLALAESYMDGDWECPDLTSLFDLALANEDTFSLSNRGGWFYKTINRLRHLMNANSKKGSKRNISYHYDLGNDFYTTWLDETMTYSSALFEGDESLSDAQLRKYRTIADMADLKSGESVLEIGCGWGGFSEIAAREYQSNVTGVTLSQEQLAFANERYHNAGIDHLASAQLTDYRDVKGQFDKIVSIEMFEAVGYENWDTYFSTIKKRLKAGGSAVLQVILIEDDRFDSYRKNVDFIQRYIFPGGLLPSQAALSDAIGRNDLTLKETQLFGQSYAKTCEIWQRSFQHAWTEIKSQGFDDRFKRMWEYYLSYCEAGFKSGTINVGFFKIVNDPA